MTHKNDQTEAEALRLLDEVLDVPEPERLAWLTERTKDHPKLKARVLALMDVDTSDAPLTGGAAQAVLDEIEPVRPERIGSYRIERLIGRGGMGEVYYAERDADDFDHSVAIKVIRGLKNTPKLTERLRAERQTLARLKHPGIAQLFDGGETDSGDPFFIMEYVDGRSLREALEKGEITDAQALTLMLEVGEAVQHAHQKLTVHHDLSPSNILITKEGHAKLIDFGISQSLGAADETTSSRYTRTKGYAAPEREKGEAATTLSDIYSLGVVFREMMAGRPLPRRADLDAILDKATADDPEARYEDVGAFLHDLNQYTGRRSVPARSTRASYRVRRFVGRHPLSVFSGVLALGGLLVAVGAMSLLYIRAERAEMEARERFEDTRGLATTMLTEIFPEIDRVPGTRKARRMMAEAGETYLERLEQSPRTTPELTEDRVRGLLSLGRIMGSPKGGAFDDPDAGERHLQRAQELLGKLIEEDGPTPERLLLLGKAHFYLAEIRIDPHGDLEGAFANLDLSEKALLQGLELSPESLDLKRSLLLTQGYRNTPVFRQGDKEEAEAINRKAIEDGVKLLAEHPDDKELLRFVAGQRRAMGEVLTLSSRFVEAIDVLDQAIADLDRLEELEGQDVYSLRGRSIAWWRLAFALYNVDRLDEALAAYDQAISIVVEREQRDPTDMDAAFMRVSFLSEQARVFSALGRYGEAEEALFKGLRWHEKRLEEEPGLQARQRSVAVQHYQLADHFKNKGDDVQRCVHAQKIETYFQMMADHDQLQASDKQAWPIVAAEHPACSLSESL